MKGPRITILASCHGCEHLEVTEYEAMGEQCAGFGCRLLARDLVNSCTPADCPYLKAAVVEKARPFQ